MDMTLDFDSVTIAAILRSAATQAALETALATKMSLRAQVAAEFDLTMLRTLRGDVVFLDIDTANSAQMRTLAHFMAEEETGPVVVTSSNLNVASMREFMRLGLSDVLPQPFVDQDVANALQRAAGRRHVAPIAPSGDDEHRRGSVVSFIKSGGGVGATSLATRCRCDWPREERPSPVRA
jgi:DNA-binding NtrC family response regulator